MTSDSNRREEDLRHRSLQERAEIRRAVEAAARWREALFGPFGREPATSAYRLVHGEGDGLAGIAVDAYAGFLVVQVLREEALERADLVEAALEDALRPRGIVRKLRYRQVGRGRVEDLVARGEKPPGVLTVVEDGVPFEVELLGSLHTGLFTDLREERIRLRRLAAGRRVLNAFAYTGAFSVAAALGGAARVTTVDVVEKALERARRNFLLAGLDPGAHFFARMDVREYLRMAGRRGWRFDAAVLDPPTFAAFKSGSWALKNEYPDLLELSFGLLEEGGLLWATANTESLPAEKFEGFIAEALERSGRRAQTLALSGLPPDYPTPPSRPELRYLKVCVLRLL